MIDWSLGSYERTAAQLAPAAGHVVDAAEIAAGDRVLDVGCGTGNAALLAAMRGARATGVDPAERLLVVAARRAETAGVDAAWVQGDALALPFDDDGFDATLSVFGVIFARPEQDAVDELVRVTAPGGRIVLSTWTSEGALAAGGGVLRRALAERAPDSTAGPAPRDWGDPDHLRALFAPHGLVPEVDPQPHVFTADSAESFADEWLALHPMWLAARPVLGDENYLALREPLIAALEAGNEDPRAFRATSSALLVRVDLP